MVLTCPVHAMYCVLPRDRPRGRHHFISDTDEPPTSRRVTRMHASTQIGAYCCIRCITIGQCKPCFQDIASQPHFRSMRMQQCNAGIRHCERQMSPPHVKTIVGQVGHFSRNDVHTGPASYAICLNMIIANVAICSRKMLS